MADEVVRLLNWDADGERFFETGVDRGVFYPLVSGKYENGVVWNGLSSVSESPSGGEATPIYADNRKYLNILSAEDYGATVEAYTCPDEFAEYDGSKEIAPGVFAGQQARKPFGLCYRSLIGNDEENTKKGYKLHIIYNALAAPSEKTHSTVNESSEAATMSWTLSTTPVEIPGGDPSAKLTIDSTKTTPEKMALIEEILYGKKGATEDLNVAPRMPLPAEIITLLKS